MVSQESSTAEGAALVASVDNTVVTEEVMRVQWSGDSAELATGNSHLPKQVAG